MDEDVTIRNALCSDIQKMIDIELSAAKIFSTLPLRFLQKLPDSLPLHDEQFYQTLVSLGMSWLICVNGEAVGFLCAKKILTENTLHIDEFGVGLPFQGKGLGRKLLSYVIDFCHKNQISKITLTTFKTVSWNAPFYEKLGFTMIDEADWNKRLQDILHNEMRIGLPKNMRCAMELCLV